MPLHKKRAIPSYPHFDAPISQDMASKIASSPALVAKHSFLPLLSYDLTWVPFKNRGKPQQKKSRSIRYAARRDSFIFSQYREMLAPLYEERLLSAGLVSNVLAYRKIPDPGKSRNKSNIQFAKDVFVRAQSMAPCHAICLDITKFFDNLDHLYLKKAWMKLLGVPTLPKDHFAVYRAVTSFAYVDRIEAYKALDIIGDKIDSSGQPAIGFKKKWNEMPQQLCSPSDYRLKVKPLVKANSNAFGIPQGIPMSDLLSNLYLFEFDRYVKDLVVANGGEYYRYSDDILVLLPENCDHTKIEAAIVEELRRTGSRMEIKSTKSSTHLCRIDPASRALQISQIKPMSEQNGLEYLGFRFDGTRIFIRSSTLTRLHRRITSSIRAHVKGIVAANPNVGLVDLRSLVNYDLIHGRFGRRPEDREVGTFFSYAKRAHSAHESLGSGSVPQLRKIKRFIRRRADREVLRAFARLSGSTAQTFASPASGSSFSAAPSCRRHRPLS